MLYCQKYVIVTSWICLIAIYLIKGGSGCKTLFVLPCNKNKTLRGHVIKSYQISAPEQQLCRVKCYIEHSCVSYNLGPVVGKIRSCELNSFDHVTNPDDVIDQQGFEYCPFKNPCSSNPCKDNKVCTPDSTWDSFNCRNGAWSHWSEWSSCHCPHYRTRTCRNPFTKAPATDCPGQNLETKGLVLKNCVEVLKCGCKNSGVHVLNPDGGNMFMAYCDQATDGGGWAVFQKRKDGSEDFFRGWQDYKNGFGNLTGEFWLGLDNIYRLTHQSRNRLRVELEDIIFAEYEYFAVSDETNDFRLSVGTYSGNAGDSLTYHNGKSFTTKDHDNDKIKVNCALKFKGGWWYSSCHASNLNGLYLNGSHSTYADGINWKAWKGFYYSAKKAEIKIRPT